MSGGALDKQMECVAIIKPLIKEKTSENKIIQLEEQGVLRKAIKGNFPHGRPITITGKSLSETVIEGRGFKNLVCGVKE